MKIYYQIKFFNDDFNNFDAFLVIFNSSGGFNSCLKAPFSDIFLSCRSHSFDIQ